MKVSDLFEGISPVLFHFTSIHSLYSILHRNEFMLTPDLGTDSDSEHNPKGKIYYLSTTRHKLGGYHLGNHQGVMLVLDGRRLQNVVTGSPVDYWGPEMNAAAGEHKREAEDRIFSRDRYIKNAKKYIKEVHLLKPDHPHHRRDNMIRLAAIEAKKDGVPFFVYEDQQAWLLQDTRRAITPDYASFNINRDDKPYIPRSRDHFKGWRELALAPVGTPLSDEAKYVLNRILRYTPDAITSLKNDFHNNKSSRDEGMEKLLDIMARLRINSVKDFVLYLENKWR